VVLGVPAAHSPWPVQVPHTSHWQLDIQVRDCVPQLPQSCVSVSLGVQTPCPVQVPQLPQAQLAVHVLV
jgi:hypothetical protein